MEINLQTALIHAIGIKSNLLLPLPTCNFRQIFTILMNILGVLNKLVAHLLVEVCTSVAKLRQILDGILNKVETVHVILHTNIERCSDCTLFLVAANVHQTVVVTTIGKLVYQG